MYLYGLIDYLLLPFPFFLCSYLVTFLISFKLSLIHSTTHTLCAPPFRSYLYTALMPASDYIAMQFTLHNSWSCVQESCSRCEFMLQVTGGHTLHDLSPGETPDYYVWSPTSVWSHKHIQGVTWEMTPEMGFRKLFHVRISKWMSVKNDHEELVVRCSSSGF